MVSLTRLESIAKRLRALPTADKLRAAAEMLAADTDLGLVREVVRMALFDLDALCDVPKAEGRAEGA